MLPIQAFHKTAKALVDFGLSSRHMLATTRLPIGEAAKVGLSPTHPLTGRCSHPLHSSNPLLASRQERATTFLDCTSVTHPLTHREALSATAQEAAALALAVP